MHECELCENSKKNTLKLDNKTNVIFNLSREHSENKTKGISVLECVCLYACV